MTKKQLLQVEKAVKPFYKKAGKYHSWNHILRVEKNALEIAKNYPETNLNILLASIYLHDVGRGIKSGDHFKSGLKFANDLLKKLEVSESEAKIIREAIIFHNMNKIHLAKTIEARVLFDADKLEIATVNGFLRVCVWLVDEEGYSLSEAVNYVWKNIEFALRNNLIQTKEAKKIFSKEILVIKQIVAKYNNWEKRFQ